MAETNQPTKITKKWWFWVLLILLLSFILSIGGCGVCVYLGSKTVNEVSKDINANKVANEQKVSQKGEYVEVGKVRWRLIDAEDVGDTLKSSESNYPTITKDKKANTNAKFIKITLEVENLDTTMKSATTPNLKDDKGRQFISASDTFEWIPDDKGIILLSNLNPNIPQQFITYYEVANDAAGLKVEVGDLSFLGSDKAYISLGL